MPPSPSGPSGRGRCERTDLLDVPVVVHDHAAVRGEHVARAARTEEQGHLGQRLGLQRARAERGRTDQPGPGRPSGRGVQEVMRVALRRAPDAHVAAGGRHAAGADAQRAHALAGDRVLDLDLVRVQLCVDAADRHVAAAIDDEPRAPREAMGHGVGAQPLARAAGVDLQAGRPLDHPGVVVHGDRAPAGRGVRRAPRAVAERSRAPPPTTRAPRRPSSERSPPAARALTSVGSTRPSLCSAAQIPARTAARSSLEAGTIARRVAVERAQLAVGREARQTGGEALDVDALGRRRPPTPSSRRRAATARSSRRMSLPML